MPERQPDTSAGFPFTVERWAELDSTNRHARREIEAGRVDAARLFVADVQTAGYGRFGRAWHSPRGGLWCTLAWPCAGRDPGVPDALGLRVGAACLATVDEALHGVPKARERVRLKWPNDVLIDGRKVCGSLCETASGDGRGWLIIGVGMNVNNDPGSLPSGLRRPATSLAIVAGRALDVDRVLAALAGRLGDAAGDGPIGPGLPEGVGDRLEGIDREVSLRLPDGSPLCGVLRGLTPDGRPELLVDSRRFVAPHGVELE